jgi:hypothetical protein
MDTLTRCSHERPKEKIPAESEIQKNKLTLLSQKDETRCENRTPPAFSNQHHCPHRNLSRISHINQTTDEDVNRQTEAGAVDTTLHRHCPRPELSQASRMRHFRG